MDKIVNELNNNKDIVNFKVLMNNSNSLSVGIQGKDVGGPYSPIKYMDQISGDLHIEWSDGKISIVNITSATLENPKETIEESKSVSITDKYANEFIKKYEIKKPVNQFSYATRKILETDQSFLINELRSLIDLEREIGILKHEASCYASSSRIELMNSKGLKLSDRNTRIGFGTNWEFKMYFDIDSRTPFKHSRYEKDLKYFGELYKATKKQLKKKLNMKKLKIVLSPQATWDLIQHFVIENLRGSLVANKMSRYSKDDFVKNKNVFSSWFSLKTDPVKELTPGANNFTSEGVKTKRTELVRNGKLLTPILDLKHSKKLNMKPTPTVIGKHITTFSDEHSQDLQHFIKKNRDVLFVSDFLGLHTQNQLTGDYSLPVPYAIYIRDSEPIGFYKVILTDNFFDNLSKNVELVRNSLFPLPGICYNPGIIFEK